jgi:uncharacterized tellurite resistance protein B-like protein
MKTLEFFKDLMVMAASDGRLMEEEMAFLAQRAHRWGITDAQFTETVQYALSPEAVISIPATKGERHQLLREMVRTMAADGELADIEKNLFAVAAATMKISDAELNEIFDAVLSSKKDEN